MALTQGCSVLEVTGYSWVFKVVLLDNLQYSAPNISVFINEPFIFHSRFCSWHTGMKEMMERKVTAPGCLFQSSSKPPAKAKKCKTLHWTCSCTIELRKWEVLQSACVPPALIVKFLTSLTRHYYPFILCPKYPYELVNWALYSLLSSRMAAPSFREPRVCAASPEAGAVGAWDIWCLLASRHLLQI